jgi:hypothetical protein
MSTPPTQAATSPKQPVKKELDTSTPPPTNTTAAYLSAPILAFFLAAIFFFAYIPFSPLEWLRPYGLAMRYLAFPLFAFLGSLITNLLVQYSVCGSAKWDEASVASAYFLAPLYAGLLAGTVGYLRAPIASLFSPDEKIRGIFEFERKSDYVQAVGKSYWIFFGALIGQILAGTMAAVC